MHNYNHIIKVILLYLTAVSLSVRRRKVVTIYTAINTKWRVNIIFMQVPNFLSLYTVTETITNLQLYFISSEPKDI